MNFLPDGFCSYLWTRLRIIQVRTYIIAKNIAIYTLPQIIYN